MTLVEFKPFPNCRKKIGPPVYIEDGSDVKNGDIATRSGLAICQDYTVNGKIPGDSIGFLGPYDTKKSFDCKAVTINDQWHCGREQCDNFSKQTTN